MLARTKIPTALFCILAFGMVGPLAAQTLVFPLEGDQEVPVVVTDASGECTAEFSFDQTSLDISCTNDAVDILAAHIHNAPAGVNGPIIFFFDAGTVFSASVTSESLAAQQNDPNTPVQARTFEEFLSQLRAGDLYVNVHTVVNQGGELRGQIPAPPDTLFFPQFGNGEAGSVSISSDIVLLNSATTGGPVTGTLTAYDRNGEALPINQGMSGNFRSHEVDFSIDPLDAFTVSTDGMGEIQVGSVEVKSDGALGGIIRFAVSTSGIAGVGSADPLKGGIAPVRRAGTIRTALAIRNGSDASECTVNLSLRLPSVEGMGEEVATAEVILPARGGTAQFVDEIFMDFFDGFGDGDFSGTVVMTSDNFFAAIALEQGSALGEFTTLPVTPLQ